MAWITSSAYTNVTRFSTVFSCPTRTGAAIAIECVDFLVLMAMRPPHLAIHRLLNGLSIGSGTFDDAIVSIVTIELR